MQGDLSAVLSEVDALVTREDAGPKDVADAAMALALLQARGDRRWVLGGGGRLVVVEVHGNCTWSWGVGGGTGLLALLQRRSDLRWGSRPGCAGFWCGGRETQRVVAWWWWRHAATARGRGWVGGGWVPGEAGAGRQARKVHVLQAVSSEQWKGLAAVCRHTCLFPVPCSLFVQAVGQGL